MKKTTLVVFLVLVAGIATAFADSERKMSSSVSDYQIHLEFLNNQPKVGTNPIAVEVKGPSGNSVTDAKLFIEYSMGADKSKKMVIKEGMCFASELTCNGEKYMGNLNFDKPGKWVIHVKTIRSGKSYTATFNTMVMK
jgi:hypothetical protein